MSNYHSSTYHSEVYRKFKALDPMAYRSMVRFYEKKEKDILQLDFEEYFELLVAYVEALFEVGAYRKHLVMVDTVIELSIDHNILIYRGERLFRRMLFRKAASYFNIFEFAKAQYVLEELIRIDPGQEDVVQFYQKCRRKCRPQFLRKVRAVSIFLFLLAGLITGLEVLIVRPFYQMYASEVEWFRTILFILACVVLYAGFAYNYWLSKRDAQLLVRIVRTKKEL